VFVNVRENLGYKIGATERLILAMNCLEFG